MKISTLVFVFLCLVFLSSCAKRSSIDGPHINTFSATINGVNYTFPFYDSLYTATTPFTVIGYAGSDTTDSIQSRVILTLETGSDLHSGSINFRPAHSAVSYSTVPLTYLPVNAITLINKLAIGTFAENIYVNGDSTQAKLVVTNGNFNVGTN
ncbi:MAG TPA: hypothetical protein VK559_02275 [Ferruginibacter sp.]|nr:hypothetical protein [Ferruginibacter sp.]